METVFALADEDMALLNGLGWLAQWCAPQFAHDALGLAPLVRQTDELGMCAYNFTFQSLDNLARNPVNPVRAWVDALPAPLQKPYPSWCRVPVAFSRPTSL